MPNEELEIKEQLHAILLNLIAVLVPLGLGWMFRKLSPAKKPAVVPTPFPVNEVK